MRVRASRPGGSRRRGSRSALGSSASGLASPLTIEKELERALALSPDYVALGPIYPTLLKPMTFAPQGLARIGEWKARVGAIPLVAIGGLTPERAQACLRAGADSACVVTDVLRHANPEARAKEWLAATAEYR